MQAQDRIMEFMCTVAVLPNILRPFYLVYGLCFDKIRRAIGTAHSVADYARKRVNERKIALESKGSEKDPGRRDILSKLFELAQSKGNEEDFTTPDIQQEGYVGM